MGGRRDVGNRPYLRRTAPDWHSSQHAYVERKPDYQKRARRYNKKKKLEQVLAEKGRLRNKDEFRFMLKNPKVSLDSRGMIAIAPKVLKADVEADRTFLAHRQTAIQKSLHRGLEEAAATLAPCMDMAPPNPQSVMEMEHQLASLRKVKVAVDKLHDARLAARGVRMYRDPSTNTRRVFIKRAK